jgi:hypothetical protein
LSAAAQPAATSLRPYAIERPVLTRGRLREGCSGRECASLSAPGTGTGYVLPRPPSPRLWHALKIGDGGADTQRAKKLRHKTRPPACPARCRESNHANAVP